MRGPQLQPAVTRRCKPNAMRTTWETIESTRAPRRDTKCRTGRRVPQPDRSVETPRRQARSIWTERHADDVVRVALQATQFATTGHVPHPNDSPGAQR